MSNVKKTIVKKAIGYIFVFFGVFICYSSLQLNTIETRIIDMSSYAVSNGASVESFKNYTSGLLAGGKITALPRILVWGIALFGIMTTYLGVYMILNNPLLKLFSLSYWKHFQKRFYYKNYAGPAIRKKILKRKK